MISEISQFFSDRLKRIVTPFWLRPRNGGGRIPHLTQQAQVNQQRGEPIQILISEIVIIDRKKVRLFGGIRSFFYGRAVLAKTSADLAIDRLSDDLREKASILGADAVVSLSINAVRGVESGGQRLVRFTAVGTAVRFAKNLKKRKQHD